MHDVKTYTTQWGGQGLSIETGKLALLANATARVQLGETVVLATVTMSRNIRDDINYFPLMVDYEENFFAAGKIKGSRFMKRKGRPSDSAVVNARITDRSLRPLFDYNIRNDIQVILNVMSYDGVNDPAGLGLIAASAALHISDIPWDGPVAGVPVALVEGEYILNPTKEQREASSLYMMLATREDRIVMIEAEGNQSSEDEVFAGFEFAMEQGQPIVELIKKMREEIGQEKAVPTVNEPTEEEKAMHEAVTAQAADYLGQHMESLFGITAKDDRDDKEAEVKDGLLALFETEEEQKAAGKVFEEQYEKAFRKIILEKGVRVDGREMDKVREIYAEVDLLPRTHGSGLFQRGETQALTTVTLGAPGDQQIIDGLDPEYQKRYMHHYSFPPYSVGEVRPLRGPGRREIGHGTLAEKALEPVIPAKEDFPYTILVNSDILMSNGSSSQASACGSTLALMAAGVPLKNPVAGIAMGLVMTEDMNEYKILTDIQGVEDHAGDMDFKVAGTTEGVTAIQLDIKLGGISLDICRDALAGAKKARLDILEVMAGAIAEPRTEMSPYAPRIEVVTIAEDKIGDLIGPGGKVINAIIEETGAQIDIEEDGTVFVTTSEQEGMGRALELIKQVTRDIVEGEVIEGPVTQIVTNRDSGTEIGAIVDLGGGRDGMIHISNVCNGRIDKVTDVIEEGEVVKVKVMEVDKERGRIGLSRKAMIEPGTPDPKCEAATGGGGFDGGRPQRGKDDEGDHFNPDRGPKKAGPRPSAPKRF